MDVVVLFKISTCGWRHAMEEVTFEIWQFHQLRRNLSSAGASAAVALSITKTG